jgi:hypothetical protein
VLRAVGTGLLAGFSGAAFGGLAAAFLHLSVPIAATVSGLSLAAIVTFLICRHPPDAVRQD